MSNMKKILPWLLLLMMLVLAGVYAYLIFGVGINPEFLDLYKKNFLVIIGLPLAAMASLFLVLILEYSKGPIEFEALGFKFKGASGPLVMWVICFLAIACAFKLLWNGNYV
jgi:hypothetical protein